MSPLRATGIAVSLCVAPLAFSAETPTSDELEFFEAKIRPVLAANCYACHSADAKVRMGGLSLDTREGIRQGGQRGHAVVPGDVESSVVVGALRYDGELKMPPGGRLSEEIVSDFEKWIRMGAPDPRVVTVQVSTSSIDLEKGREFWAFQAPVTPQAPSVKNLSWPLGMIDQFVLAELESRGLRPAPDAEKADLLRRVTYDLTGLPPTPEELETFLADSSADAYARVVDGLLDSDRFGERWARHWLDVVRYADTVGRTRNAPFPVAWKYRDYVIRSFNADKPYDRFVQEQIAGDLIPYSGPAERVESQVATGFLAIGANDLNEPDAKQFEMDVADEMINVSTRSFLALSVGCARCHDHKFDPIPTKDYYALAGIFRSSDLRSGLRRRPRFNAGYFRTERLVKLDGLPEYSSANAVEVRAERERLWTALQAAEEARDRQKCREYARALGKLPMPENLAMGVVEADQPVPMKVNIGGDPHTLGESVNRGFVQALFPAGADLPRIGKQESGRLQLAEWLTRRDNPLTSRVMVNRVWHHLLGKGIVATVDNFGAMGRQPTNQLLLDYLAVQFMDQGWSVKSLIREVVLSRTYRLSSGFVNSNFEVDPDNDYLWRANVRRLEAESVRDAVLFVSGELQDGPPPPSPVNSFDRNQLINANNRQIKPWETEESYRSVYVPVIRNLANRLFEAFDFPEPSETRGARDITTGPSQALFMMNNEFVRKHAAIAAERLIAARGDDVGRVRYAFQQVLSREPSPAELDRALDRIRGISEFLDSNATSEGSGADATSWLAGFMTAVLDREPAEEEMATAMEYLSDRFPTANESADAMASAFRDEEGSLRGGVALEMIRSALGRGLDREERSVARKNLRDWHVRQGKDSRESLAMAASPEQEAWSRFYHALYNSAEFRYRN